MGYLLWILYFIISLGFCSVQKRERGTGRTSVGFGGGKGEKVKELPWFNLMQPKAREG